MASRTKVYKVRKKLKARKAGRDRKNTLARKSTPSKSEFFGDAGKEPASK